MSSRIENLKKVVENLHITQNLAVVIKIIYKVNDDSSILQAPPTPQVTTGLQTPFPLKC